MRLIEFSCKFTVAGPSRLAAIAVPVAISIDQVDSRTMISILQEILYDPPVAPAPAAPAPTPAAGPGRHDVLVWSGPIPKTAAAAPSKAQPKKRVTIPWSDEDLETIKPATSRKDAVKRYLRVYPGSPRPPKNIGDMWSYLKRKKRLTAVVAPSKPPAHKALSAIAAGADVTKQLRPNPGDTIRYEHQYNPAFDKKTGTVTKIDGGKCLVNFGTDGSTWVGLKFCTKIEPAPVKA